MLRAPPAADPDESFNLRVTKDLWPEFCPGDGGSEGVGQLFFDFTDSSQKRWARGEDTGREFGRSVFPNLSRPSDVLPSRLFDLVENRVVMTDEAGPVPYAIISHVWGEVVEVDGNRYGVDWQIPIRHKVKLDQMLTAAKIIGGIRHIWIDILCLDQRTKNESEIAKMGMYYANASGCLVWLDNAFNGPDWLKVLSSIEEVNKFFKMDKSGASTISVEDMLRDGIANLSLSGGEAFQWVRKIVAIEKAPWFNRVWTLQEAVIPNSLYLCTPERYMVGGASLFQLLSLCGMVAKLLLDVGAMAGVAVTHELQKSEIWKILRLRQLYRRKRISYWHLFQATRSRKSKYEQDRVFGVSGLINGRIPTIDYHRDIEELYLDLYRSSLEQREFGACCFLGDGETTIVPNKECVPHIISGVPDEIETHQLKMCQDGLQLDGVGIDPVRRVWVIVPHGSLTAWNHPAFMDLTTNDHIDIAKAYGMPTDTIGTLCPAAFAAISSMSPLEPALLAAFGKEFAEKYETLVPKGLLMWSKVGTLMQASEDNAFVVIWTASSEPQLAVVTERVQGTVFVVTPSSYADRPGEGCMICQLTLNGTLKKIGLGIGMQVKASSKASLLLV
jgi:Heterokaryon incompatibility protein (HET)